METKSKKGQQHAQSRLDATSHDFDFELWAGEVKRQMLASLQRRAPKP